MTDPTERGPNDPFIYNDPGNFDIWQNPTEHTFVVGCHIEHKGGAPTRINPRGGPRTQYFKFLPKSETPVPTEYRYVIQTYLCNDAECQSSPGTKLCYKDHPAVIMGGKCPQLVRKGATHIRQNSVFDDSMAEIRKVDATGRVYYELEKKEDINKLTTQQPRNAPPGAARKSAVGE